MRNSKYTYRERWFQDFRAPKRLHLLLLFGLISTQTAFAKPPNQEVDLPSISIGGTYKGGSSIDSTPLKFRGTSGGGGPCEAGCESKPTKLPNPPNTPAEIAKKTEDERKRVQDKIESYLRSAYFIWNTYGSPYLTIRSVEYIGNKLFFEWVTRAASLSVYGLYISLRPTEIGVDLLDPTEANKHLDELKRIKPKEKTLRDEYIKGDDLPEDLRPPYFDSAKRAREEELRQTVFRKPNISREEAKFLTRKFLKENEGAPYGELIATILEVYDQDIVAAEGLPAEAVEWMRKFSERIREINRKREQNAPANVCLIHTDRRLCPINGGKSGDSCYCNAAPGKIGRASARPTGSICETPIAYCELPMQQAFNTGCGCKSTVGVHSGTVKW